MITNICKPHLQRVIGLKGVYQLSHGQHSNLLKHTGLSVQAYGVHRKAVTIARPAAEPHKLPHDGSSVDTVTISSYTDASSKP